jgi:hypothetical protein
MNCDDQVLQEYLNVFRFFQLLSTIHRTFFQIICIIIEHAKRNAKRDEERIFSAYIRRREDVQSVAKSFSVRSHIDSFRFRFLHQTENRRIEF